MLIEQPKQLEGGEILMCRDATPFEAGRPGIDPQRERATTVSGADGRHPARLHPGPPRYKIALLVIPALTRLLRHWLIRMP